MFHPEYILISKRDTRIQGFFHLLAVLYATLNSYHCRRRGSYWGYIFFFFFFSFRLSWFIVSQVCLNLLCVSSDEVMMPFFSFSLPPFGYSVAGGWVWAWAWARWVFFSNFVVYKLLLYRY